MIDFDVVPGQSVGPVTQGMTRPEVQSVMPDEDRESFLTDPSFAHQTDAWFDAGFQVFYQGEPATVSSVKLSRGSGFRARCFGIDLFGTPAEQVANALSGKAALDIDDPQLGCSYRFPSLELVLWRPFEPDDEDDDEARYFSTVTLGFETASV